MDALPDTPDPQTGDEPLSVDVLRKLIYDKGALTLDELGRLLGGYSRSGTHRYLEGTELKFGQLLLLLHHAESDEVRREFYSLLRASGWAVNRLPVAMDVDGDGDIDTNDAIAQMIQTLAPTQEALEALQGADAGCLDAALAEARQAVNRQVELGCAVLSVIDHIDKHTPRRRKAVERV